MQEGWFCWQVIIGEGKPAGELLSIVRSMLTVPRSIAYHCTVVGDVVVLEPAIARENVKWFGTKSSGPVGKNYKT